MKNRHRYTTTDSPGQSFLALIGFTAATFIAGLLGAWASVRAGDMYQVMKLPSWAPPAWLFGTVWTTLYVMMAVAAWLVWRKRHVMRVDLCLFVFLLHLVIQALWSGIFFGLGQAGWAMLDILILGAMITWLMCCFWRVSRLAGWLFLPYLLWVTFASILNATIWILNGHTLPR